MGRNAARRDRCRMLVLVSKRPPVPVLLLVLLLLVVVVVVVVVLVGGRRGHAAPWTSLGRAPWTLSRAYLPYPLSL